MHSKIRQFYIMDKTRRGVNDQKLKLKSPCGHTGYYGNKEMVARELEKKITLLWSLIFEYWLL